MHHPFFRLEGLLGVADEGDIIAIGGTGVDYFHGEKGGAGWQRERFWRHIPASKQSGKPMIIHIYAKVSTSL
jgi:TatD DNase family protein